MNRLLPRSGLALAFALAFAAQVTARQVVAPAPLESLDSLPPAPPAPAVRGTPRDVFCGPRCVQRILAEYGELADLAELVQETQWPRYEEGATLAALDAALRKRGVATLACRLDSLQQLRAWPHPVLVHFRRSGAQELGHYAVWLPSGDGARVWGWSDPEVDDAPFEALDGQFSGHVLLTSNRPIEPDAVQQLTAAAASRRPIAWAFVGLAAIGAALVWFRRARARAPTSDETAAPRGDLPPRPARGEIQR